MTAKPPVNRKKRFLKLCLITFGSMALVILGLHIWFVNNARRVIIQTVAERSHGKLKLELSQLSFHFLSSQLQVKQARLVSTDTTTQTISYNITFDKLSIKVGSFWPLLFNKEIAIDSVEVLNPIIDITQWRKDTTKTSDQEEISIPRQMGRLYNSMLDGLDAFGIKRIRIDNASVSLINKLKPGHAPVVISGIDFNLVKKGNGEKRDEFIPKEQTVDLSTHQQDIALPGGRHRLAFRSFNLNLFNKRMQLDSCTVTAIARDSTHSSYTIFFEKLLLVGVDFNAMYQYNLIKADSVYCENPLFDININTLYAQSPKKERPDPNKIIQELTGDLDLAFIGVKHAGIRINITGKNNRSLFNSNKDDFEMRGLRIYADSAQPVVIDRFDMLVRDYHLYNEDSSATYTFDSIHFQNNKITLNNFLVTTTSSPGKLRSERDFRIPYFELTGLDWNQLIFEENLVAQEAVLYNPVIKYTRRNTGQVRKTNIFRSLQLLDNFMTLDRISLVNGQLDMKLGPNTALNISNANISLNKITEDLTGLREAITRLSFSNAVIKLKDLDAVIENASYSGKELVHADRILLKGKSNRIRASINDVFVNNVLVNEKTESLTIDGLKWNSADIRMAAPLGNSKKSSQISLSNIEGNNTRLQYTIGETKVSTFIHSLKLASFDKAPSSNALIQGLLVSGSQLDLQTKNTNITSSSYLLNSEGGSELTNLEVNQVKDQDTLSLKTPQLGISANINDLVSGKMHLRSVNLVDPVFRLHTSSKINTKDSTRSASIRIDKMHATNPDVNVVIKKNDSIARIWLPYFSGSHISVSGLSLTPDLVEAGNISLQTNSATFTKKNGEVMGVEDGKVDLDLSGFRYQTGEKPSWGFVINQLHLVNPHKFSLGGNNQLHLQQTTLGNFSLSSGSVSNFQNFLKDNISAWMRSTTGHYADSNTIIRWYNANYNSASKTFRLDSFEYMPALPRDSIMARAQYQSDYITLKTGALHLKGFNLEKFEKDSSLIADTITVQDPHMTVYRDKKLPYQSGRLKPLPVDMIRNINMPVDVKHLEIMNGLLEYTEKNAKTGAEGTLVLNRVESHLSNIRNRNFDPEDSLTFILSAYLMDSALLNLRVRESYTDSLHGFLMTLRLKPTTVSFINPVLVPFTNVLITSGTIDSFHLRAIGYEDLAIGEMQMYYHDLRIKLIKNGINTRSSLADRIGNFIVNNFVIKKNNKGRTGLVYYQRAKDRSFFNYLVKMTFSGMATSIGVKKNKKYIKEYRKALRERNIPENLYE